jgi:hypothetical protein
LFGVLVVGSLDSVGSWLYEVHQNSNIQRFTTALGLYSMSRHTSSTMLYLFNYATGDKLTFQDRYVDLLGYALLSGPWNTSGWLYRALAAIEFIRHLVREVDTSVLERGAETSETKYMVPHTYSDSAMYILLSTSLLVESNSTMYILLMSVASVAFLLSRVLHFVIF